MKNKSHSLIAIVNDMVSRLKAIGDDTATQRPSVGQWSQKEILGHLIDSASNNHQRFVRVMQAGELVFPPYDQEAWVTLQSYQTAQWADLIQLWQQYNRHLSHVIGQMTDTQAGYLCTVGNDDPMPLKQLVEDYMSHMKMHLRQLGVL